MNRKELLEKAINLTVGERNEVHGCPVESMEVFTEVLNALGYRKKKHKLGPVDGANILMAYKLARTAKHSTGHEDSLVDLAAYAGIAQECADEPTRRLNEFMAANYKPGDIIVKGDL